MLQSRRNEDRSISIDLLKCLAALLITNSHMGVLYGKYSFLATGGCIGDVLFFFCSGFTLFMKPMNGIKEFPNWFKKRFNRLYPPLIAVAILGALFFNDHYDIIQIAWPQHYWFVKCILLYYVAIFFIGSYLEKHIVPISILVAVGTAVWFVFVCRAPGFSIYGGHYIRWLLFFAFMLFGAKIGTMADRVVSRPVLDAFLLILLLIAFYTLFILGTRVNSLVWLQYFSFIPLLGVVYYLYKVGTSNLCKQIYNSKVGNIIRFIGGLCFEIYLVQRYLFTDKMNHLFPFNIFLMFLIIFIFAYLTRCLARFIAQTFKDAPYCFREIVSIF